MADGVTPGTERRRILTLANAGRRQLKVRGVPAWDAIKAFIQIGIRAPISPVARSDDPDIVAGRRDLSADQLPAVPRRTAVDDCRSASRRRRRQPDRQTN